MKTFERFVCFGFLIIAFLIACNLISCKSVQKAQSSKSETAKVVKSDSTKTSSYTFSDTTKTDSSLEVTTTKIEIDDAEWHPSSSMGGVTSIEYLPAPVKAKKVTIVTVSTKQAAIVSKGVTIKSDSAQKNIKSDSAIAKTEEIKTVVKKAHPVKMILGVTLGIIIIGCILYLWLVVYKKKKKIITGLIK